MEEEVLRTELGKALKDITFPKGKKELVSELGKKEIKLEGGETCRLAEVIDKTSKGLYTSRAECARVVLDYVEGIRVRTD